MTNFLPIRRALISVSDKRGLIELAETLSNLDIQLLASGGTRSALIQAGFEVIDVADYTGHPEMLGGRVKTLHPKIHGGILARRELEEDLTALRQQGIELIDLVVVNLYPFEDVANRNESSLDDAVENIDIGGPAMLRSAAKNYRYITVLSSPDQYKEFAQKLGKHRGTFLQERQEFARAVFEITANYDRAISVYLAHQFQNDQTIIESVFPRQLEIPFQLKSVLRYGENPHQRAALYVESGATSPSIATAKILHGKELSFNNILDLDNAMRLMKLFDRPAAAILKHNNPCGVAEANTLEEAFELAYLGDQVSAFGGIVGLNRRVDLATAKEICKPGRFIEAILAPDYDDDALSWITSKPSWKNSVRLLATHNTTKRKSHINLPSEFDLKRIEGGLLVQDWDSISYDKSLGRVVSERVPNDDELASMSFAWKVSQSVKSNAIVLVKNHQVVGVGAGQMSRLDSVKIAMDKAGERARGSVLASDAFFPFRDGPDHAIEGGVTAIVQPGGSKRDVDSINACNEKNIAMIFTDRRHFRH